MSLKKTSLIKGCPLINLYYLYLNSKKERKYLYETCVSLRLVQDLTSQLRLLCVVGINE